LSTEAYSIRIPHSLAPIKWMTDNVHMMPIQWMIDKVPRRIDKVPRRIDARWFVSGGST
jgi:hypothetical protein